MIKLNRIIPPTLEIYNPIGKLIGEVNEYELLDILVKIKKAQICGYYLIFKGKSIRIDKNGVLEEYPKGLLDTMFNYNIQLI